MEEERAAAEAAAEEGQDENGGKQGKTWYPYITKVQFEKFLSRLESKVPEQIDRDYVRAIIRTPSMIYRFLRGIEAMGLIDRDQHLTPRLTRLISKETRKFALAEVIRELYKELLPEWEQTDGNMSDDAVVDYFRDRTGMGRDSANKMKMFFKYLIGEADFGEPPEGIETVEPEAKAAPAPAPEPAPEPAPAPAPAPAPTISYRNLFGLLGTGATQAPAPVPQIAPPPEGLATWMINWAFSGGNNIVYRIRIVLAWFAEVLNDLVGTGQLAGTIATFILLTIVYKF